MVCANEDASEQTDQVSPVGAFARFGPACGKTKLWAGFIRLEISVNLQAIPMRRFDRHMQRVFKISRKRVFPPIIGIDQRFREEIFFAH